MLFLFLFVLLLVCLYLKIMSETDSKSDEDLEFIKILSWLKPIITGIMDKNCVDLVKLWLEKLSGSNTLEKADRNKYLVELGSQITAGVLYSPFDSPPPSEGSLPYLCDAQQPSSEGSKIAYLWAKNYITPEEEYKIMFSTPKFLTSEALPQDSPRVLTVVEKRETDSSWCDLTGGSVASASRIASASKIASPSEIASASRVASVSSITSAHRCESKNMRTQAFASKFASGDGPVSNTLYDEDDDQSKGEYENKVSQLLGVIEQLEQENTNLKKAVITRLNPKGATPNDLISNVITPNVLTPNVLRPNVLTPNVLKPNVLIPNVMTPNDLTPNVMTPNVMTPKVMTPNVMARNATTPNIMEGNSTTRNIMEGNNTTPNVMIPNAMARNVKTPNVITPKPITPKLKTPKTIISKTISPKNITSKNVPPKNMTPKNKTSKNVTPKPITPNHISSKTLSPKPLTSIFKKASTKNCQYEGDRKYTGFKVQNLTEEMQIIQTQVEELLDMKVSLQNSHFAVTNECKVNISLLQRKLEDLERQNFELRSLVWKLKTKVNVLGRRKHLKRKHSDVVNRGNQVLRDYYCNIIKDMDKNFLGNLSTREQEFRSRVNNLQSDYEDQMLKMKDIYEKELLLKKEEIEKLELEVEKLELEEGLRHMPSETANFDCQMMYDINSYKRQINDLQAMLCDAQHAYKKMENLYCTQIAKLKCQLDVQDRANQILLTKQKAELMTKNCTTNATISRLEKHYQELLEGQKAKFYSSRKLDKATINRLREDFYYLLQMFKLKYEIDIKKENHKMKFAKLKSNFQNEINNSVQQEEISITFSKIQGCCGDLNQTYGDGCRKVDKINSAKLAKLREEILYLQAQRLQLM